MHKGLTDVRVGPERIDKAGEGHGGGLWGIGFRVLDEFLLKGLGDFFHVRL